MRIGEPCSGVVGELVMMPVTRHDGGMARVLVTEEIADAGLDRLRAAGHVVDVQLGLNGEALIAALQGAQALIVRSATNVDAAVLSAVSGLLVVGRAPKSSPLHQVARPFGLPTAASHWQCPVARRRLRWPTTRKVRATPHPNPNPKDPAQKQ